jgi:DNA-binding transcriptional MocR family regulator
VSAGLTAYVTLPEGWDSGEVVELARRGGIGVYQVPDPLMPPDVHAATLTLGFGTQRPSQITEGLRLLAAALDGRVPTGSAPVAASLGGGVRTSDGDREVSDGLAAP